MKKKKSVTKTIYKGLVKSGKFIKQQSKEWAKNQELSRQRRIKNLQMEAKELRLRAKVNRLKKKAYPKDDEGLFGGDFLGL